MDSERTRERLVGRADTRSIQAGPSDIHEPSGEKNIAVLSGMKDCFRS
jgi:hypothetical protein